MELKKQSVLPEQIEAIRKLVKPAKFSYLEDLRWNGDYPKALLYPTDDFCLYERQFRCIAALPDASESLYVMKTAYDGDSLAPDNVMYSLPYPYEFSAYEKLWLDTPTVMFSDSLTWMVITDESTEEGEGIFIGEPERFAKFQNFYGNSDDDTRRFIDFSLRNHRERCVPLDHMKSIILQICGIAWDPGA